MKNSFRTALCIICSFCLAAVVFAGCAQMGEQRTPGQYGVNNYTTNTRNQGYGTNNLAGGRYNTGNGNTARNNYGTNLGANNGMNYGVNNGANTGMNYGVNTGNTRINNGANTGYDTNFMGTQMSAADRQKASAIKRQLSSMNGVDEAEVIVKGVNALIGVRTAGSTSTGQLRNAITKRVRQIDSTIQNVTVSDTSDILERMRNLGTGTRTNTGTTTNNGINNMMNDVADEFNKGMQRANNMTR